MNEHQRLIECGLVKVGEKEKGVIHERGVRVNEG